MLRGGFKLLQQIHILHRLGNLRWLRLLALKIGALVPKELFVVCSCCSKSPLQLLELLGVRVNLLKGLAVVSEDKFAYRSCQNGIDRKDYLKPEFACLS